MVRKAVVVLGAVAGWSTLVAGQASTSIGVDNLKLVGVKAEPVRHLDRQAVRLIEPDSSRGGGMAIVKGVTFGDGEISIDVAGRRGQYAVPDDRGFIGVAFRITPDESKYEYIYLRPDNGRADDQVRRNHSTQYASHPDFPWPRMRKEFPERYESYVDLESGAWTPIRIVVSGTKARLFVHGASQPTLVVNDLKMGNAQGGLGLWIGPGTEGFFSNLRVRPS
jgi:hypothetical protein